MAKKTGTSRKKLTPALAKRVEAEVRSKKARLAEAAKADVELILRRRARIAEDFYEIGLALQRLRRPAVFDLMGYESFAELCEERLDMTPQHAEKLIGMVTRVTPELATRAGQERTSALMALADATPEEDSPADLERAKLKLPNGKVLDVEKASIRELRAAAKAIREKHAKPKKRPRGRTTLPGERAKGAELEKSLRATGLDGARVEVLATKPGGLADLRIRVPINATKELRVALGKLER